MQAEIVKEIQDLTTQLGNLVVGLEPKIGADWDAMEKLLAAHKQLRNIDIEGLIEKPPRAGFTK